VKMLVVTTSNNISELSLYSRSVLSETLIVNSHCLSPNVPKIKQFDEPKNAT
jgi:hypothetical protein